MNSGEKMKKHGDLPAFEAFAKLKFYAIRNS